MKPAAPATVVLRPGRLAGILACAAGVLALCGFAGQVLKYVFGVHNSFGIVHHLNLNAESNFATWCCTAVLLLCAIVLALIAMLHRPGSTQVRGEKWYWAGLAVIFAGLSIDELAKLHEMTMDHLRKLVDATGVLHYPWVILGAAAVVVIGAIYLPFLLRLNGKTRWLFVAAGALYVGGALLMEMAGGYYASRYGEDNLTFAALAHVEESLELAGSILFLYALLDYIARHVAPVLVLVPHGQSARDVEHTITR